MMKIIFLLALLATMCTAFGQGETPHSEGLDVVKYVDDYVQKKIAEIPPKSEFETTKKWQERIDKQKKLYIHEALYELYGDPRGEKVNLRLEEYNAEGGYFPVKTNGFGSYICFLGSSDARSLKENWNKKELGYMYAFVDGEVRLVGNIKYPYFYPFNEETGEAYNFHWEDGEWISGEYERNYYVSGNYVYWKGERRIHTATGVDERPFFPGNLSTWLKDYLRQGFFDQGFIPRNIGKNVCFIVEKDGSISPSEKAYTKDEFYWSKDIIKAMPQWNPGKIKGKAVATEITIDAYELIFERPTFPGDMKQWLHDNLKYPAQARKKGISGTVNIKAIIYKDGSISVETSVEDYDKKYAPLVKEAIRLVKAMPKWYPAKRCDVPIGYRVQIPVKFKLNH